MAQTLAPAPPNGSTEWTRRADDVVQWVARHWLLLMNLGFGLFAALPVLDPLLMALGWTLPGELIFRLYHAACHQLPERSYTLFGHQVAYCQRDLAIYTTIFLSGLGFGALRRWLPPLPFRYYLPLILPMALDGLSQLFGLRESTWWLRTLTGSLFGLASVWLLFPRLERGFTDVRKLRRSAPVRG